jgi:hypothetical protein
MNPENPIQYCSEAEMDEGMRRGKFFRVRRFPETPEGEETEKKFCDDQYALIQDLERRLEEVYGERAFVSDNLWPSEKLKVEIGSNEISNHLIATILRFLLDHRSLYCVGVSVYEGSLQDQGCPYLGRILISARGITVEDSLKTVLEQRLRIRKKSE